MATAKKTAVEALDATAFRKLLKDGALTGGYLFIGEEQYLKRFCIGALRDAILTDPVFATFNHARLSYPTMNHDLFMSALESPPMMAERKLVEIHEIPFAALKEEELDDLITELSLLPSYPDTILVLYAMPEEWDTDKKNKKFEGLLKRFSAVVTPVIFARETSAKLAKWIRGHFAKAGMTIGDDTCERLRMACADDMDSLATEIDKLVAYLATHGETIVTDEVVRAVTSTTLEAGGFDFVNAILAGQCGKAYRYFYNYKANRVAVELLLGQIVRVYHALSQIKTLLADGRSADEIAEQIGMHPWQLKNNYLPTARNTPASVLAAAVDACAQADRALKLRTTDGYMVLEILIAKMAAIRRKAANT